MFNLIPWKKRNGNIRVRHDQPRRDAGDEFYPLAQFREEFGSLMDRFFGDRFMSDWPGLSLWDEPSRIGWSWDTDLEDRENEYVLHAELPGFEPEDFDVKLSGNVLTVHAAHKDEKKEKNGSSYRYGSFSRTFTLPQGVDEEKIEARYHSGVLELHVPKTEQARGRQIEVKTA